MPQATDAIRIAEANERLRQERETFDQQKLHAAKYFVVRLAMAWVVVISLPAILVTCIVIITLHGHFSDETVTAATTGLLVDGLASLFSLYKVMISGDASVSLTPVTSSQQRD